MESQARNRACQQSLTKLAQCRTHNQQCWISDGTNEIPSQQHLFTPVLKNNKKIKQGWQSDPQLWQNRGSGLGCCWAVLTCRSACCKNHCGSCPWWRCVAGCWFCSSSCCRFPRPRSASLLSCAALAHSATAACPPSLRPYMFLCPKQEETKSLGEHFSINH